MFFICGEWSHLYTILNVDFHWNQVLLAGLGIACVTAVIEYVWTKKAQHREHRVSSIMIMKGFIFIFIGEVKQFFFIG